MEDHVLRVDARRELARHLDAPDLQPRHRQLWVASTSRTWLVPMPNAIAPNAPCVEVCESPQAIVMPGCVRPMLGADHVHDALVAARGIEVGDAVLGAVALEVLDHLLGERVAERPLLRIGRNDVVDGREGALRERHPELRLADRRERLRARDLVDQVQSDEELGLAARQLADRVGVPDLVEEGL